MSRRFIPDNEFHSAIDKALRDEGTFGQDDHEPRDQFHTETLLAIENVWPESWKGLMSDGDKDRLIRLIVNERRKRLC